LRNDRRGITDALAFTLRAAVAGLGFLHLDRPNPGLDLTNRVMPVANDPLPAIRQDLVRMGGKEGLKLRFDRLRDQPPRSSPQNVGERIVDCLFLTQDDNIILGHGVTLLLEVRGGWTPTPLRRLPHAVITHFPA
jgi:hypothetical protein